MTRKPKLDRRSECPLSIGLEIFGDKWTLLILRDLMLKKLTTFKEFEGSGEEIATNILSDRLQRLQQQGIVTSERLPTDGRVVAYHPTAKGLDLLPVLVEIILWTAKYEKTAAPPKLIEKITNDRASFIASIRARFTKGEGC